MAIAWFGRERASEEQTTATSDNAATANPAAPTETGPVARLSTPYAKPADAESPEPSAYAGGDAFDTPPPRVDAATAETGTVGGPPETYARLLPPGATRSNSANDAVSNEDESAPAFKGVSRFDCEFSEGHNTAMFWDGKLQSGGASWQGGPVVYDSIDADGGIAQMIGSAGATGSLKGQAEAQVASAADRIEFLSRLENGHLIFTTVFGRRDDAGRYIAVMSRHEGGNNLGSQFRGSCR